MSNLTYTQSLNALNEIITALECTRGVGHTSLMLEGINNYESDCTLIKESGNIDNCNGKEISNVSIAGISNGFLRGYRQPIAIDNHSLLLLLKGSQSLINKAHQEVEDIKKEANNIKLQCKERDVQIAEYIEYIKTMDDNMEIMDKSNDELKRIVKFLATQL